MSLKCGLKAENDGGKITLKEIVTTRVLEMTNCEKLASLNVRCYLSHLIKTKSDEEVNEYLDRVIDRKFFDDFYRR